MVKSNEIRVWDPLVRIGHWALAVGVLVAFVVEDHWLDLHVAAGYLALGVVAVRSLWGLIGTRHARFTDFVRPPREVWGYLKDVGTFRARRHLGHNPAGGAMVLALLAMVALTGASGIVLYGAAEFSGPLAGWAGSFGSMDQEWLEEVHEACANLTLLLVGLHLAGVALASLQHRENLVRAMVTGRKAAPAEHE